jgi:hypothetical protein
MRQKVAKPEQLIARIARRQHGVVPVDQLEAAGLSPDEEPAAVAASVLARL